MMRSLFVNRIRWDDSIGLRKCSKVTVILEKHYLLQGTVIVKAMVLARYTKSNTYCCSSSFVVSASSIRNFGLSVSNNREALTRRPIWNNLSTCTTISASQQTRLASDMDRIRSRVHGIAFWLWSISRIYRIAIRSICPSLQRNIRSNREIPLHMYPSIFHTCSTRQIGVS